MGRAVIVGAGIAGMTVGKELARRNFEVHILEAAGRSGGKAGADLVNGVYEEHGYHVFPAWYLNTRALLRELKADAHLNDIRMFHILERNPNPGAAGSAASAPNFFRFHQFSPPWNAVRNVFSGIIPWHQLLLTLYFVIDLQSQPYRYRGFLDRLSVSGFLRSRFYSSETIASFQQYTALQASSIPNYELSTMTSQQIARAWMMHPNPLFSIFDGNLQERFILPFEQLVQSTGAQIHFGATVKRLHLKNGRIAGLELESGKPPIAMSEDDIYVLTTPPEVTMKFVDADVYAAEDAVEDDELPRLSDLVKLESAPMAAMHLYLKRKLPGIPREHVNLQGSRYGLSFIDVSQHWPNLPNTVLSCISADFEPLRDLPEKEMKQYLIGELLEYLPSLKKSDVARTYLQPNVKVPLFLNTVGSWHYRPGTRTRIPNLYTAGDYCRSQADLTTMESAVISALNTARDILADFDTGGHPGPISLDKAPRWFAAILKYVGLPFIAPIGIYNWLTRHGGDLLGEPRP